MRGAEPFVCLNNKPPVFRARFIVEYLWIIARAAIGVFIFFASFVGQVVGNIA